MSYASRDEAVGAGKTLVAALKAAGYEGFTYEANQEIGGGYGVSVVRRTGRFSVSSDEVAGRYWFNVGGSSGVAGFSGPMERDIVDAFRRVLEEYRRRAVDSVAFLASYAKKADSEAAKRADLALSGFKIEGEEWIYGR